MATPNQRLVKRCEQMLNQEVVAAIEVHRGPVKPRLLRDILPAIAMAFPFAAPVVGFAYWTPWAGPVAAVIGIIMYRVRLSRSDDDPVSGVVAMTADGSRILLSPGRFGPRRPDREIRRFSHNAPLISDAEALPSATLSIDGEEFEVNPVDFKVLLRKVCTDEIDSPELKAEFGDHYRRSQKLKTLEPEDYRRIRYKHPMLD